MHFDPWLKYQLVHQELQNLTPDLTQQFWSGMKNPNVMVFLSHFIFQTNKFGWPNKFVAQGQQFKR